MRVKASNLRGFKSESGIFIPNSRSSSVTRSGSANESRNPESKSDSSGSGSVLLLETLRTIAAMRSLLSILLITASFGADGEKSVVLLHYFFEEHIARGAIAGPGQVCVVALPQPRLHPLTHRAGTARGGAPIPKSAAIGLVDIALDLDNLVQVWKRKTAAAGAIFAIRRTDQENARHWNGGAQPLNDFS